MTGLQKIIIQRDTLLIKVVGIPQHEGQYEEQKPEDKHVKTLLKIQSERANSNQIKIMYPCSYERVADDFVHNYYRPHI